MSIRELPARPNLEHLTKQARALLRERLAQHTEARERFARFHVAAETPQLADALHVLAREYGFAAWPVLKTHVLLESGGPAEALLASIRAGDVDAVRAVLARHPALRQVIDAPLPGGDFDEPALLAAVQQQSRAMVDALLDFGADVNARSHWWAGGFGVLDIAQPALAEYLIARGATVDIHAAARLGKIDRVRELLRDDAGLVHARGGDGQLPLHFASTIQIAELLLEHGAQIDARDIDHESTAAQYMVCTKPPRTEVARFLLSRGAEADLLMASALGDLPLVERLLNDDPETVRMTVSDRSFPKKDPKSGGTIYLYGFGPSRTPHMLAWDAGHLAVFDLLMQRSPAWLRLVQAAEIGDEARFAEVLRKQPTLFAKLSSNAARRIVGVAVRNNEHAVKLLLDAGWPADAVLDNGQTALHYAAWHGNASMVEHLLAHGARVDALETEHGGSPVAWALHGSLHGWHRKTGDYPAATRLLLSAGAPLPQVAGPLEAAPAVLEVVSRYRPSA